MIFWQPEIEMSTFGQIDYLDPLTELFHNTTKLTLYDMAMTAARTAIEGERSNNKERNSFNYKSYPEGRRIDLNGECPPISLVECLCRRRSTRSFDKVPLHRDVVSTLLLAALSRTRYDSIEEASNSPLYRRYPSAGALYPVEHYVIAINVEELEDSVWYFHPLETRLVSVRENVDRREILKCVLCDAEWLESVGLIVVQTALFERSIVKYGSRGYRLALLEAGFAGQNILLTSAALRLGAVPWAAFLDDHVAALLNVNSTDEAVISMIVIGNQQNEGADESTSIADDA